ncbi:MAG: DUF86 domain-containing protein, partial [Anaerolineae bacterium]|nr:DUF86 domain-containing protein [Anaerolineae bacterium]
MKLYVDYLRDILIELDDIRTFTQDGYEAFIRNRMAEKAVIRSYEVIGEIVKRLPQEFCDTHSQIDWRILATFRDYLIHRYDTLDSKRIWVAVQDVDNLHQKIRALIHQ